MTGGDQFFSTSPLEPSQEGRLIQCEGVKCFPVQEAHGVLEGCALEALGGWEGEWGPS